jgi:1,2-diacylglycerol 3-alpha-glucosyltransferase
MRVLLTNNFYEPMATGSVHFTRTLGDALTALGHHVLIVTATPGPTSPGDAPAVVRLPSVSVSFGRASYDYRIPFALRPANMRALGRIFDEFQPDIVHQNGQYFDLSWMSGWIAKRHHIPTVLTIHTAVLHESRLWDAVLSVLDGFGVRAMLSTYQPTLVVADKRVQQYVQRRYPHARTARAGYPVDIQAVAAGDPSTIRHEFRLGDRRIIGSIGHVIPQRSRLLLVEALPHVLAEHPDVIAVVAGRVNDDRFLKRAADLRVSDAVLAIGPIRHSSVKNLLSASTLECHDLQGLGIGIATLEAMAAGVPVVSVNDADTFPYAPLRSGEDILLVPGDPRALAEGICRLLDDEGLRQQIGQAGAGYVASHFSPEAVARDYLGIYERATATQG